MRTSLLIVLVLCLGCASTNAWHKKQEGFVSFRLLKVEEPRGEWTIQGVEVWLCSGNKKPSFLNCVRNWGRGEEAVTMTQLFRLPGVLPRTHALHVTWVAQLNINGTLVPYPGELVVRDISVEVGKTKTFERTFQELVNLAFKQGSEKESQPQELFDVTGAPVVTGECLMDACS